MGSNVNATIHVKLISQPPGVTGAKPDLKQILSDLDNIVPDETFSIRGDTFVAEQECRWSSIEDDMRRLSRVFPNMLFTVKWDVPDYGEGPVQDYFVDGKHQRAVLTFSPFDESKLK